MDRDVAGTSDDFRVSARLISLLRLLLLAFALAVMSLADGQHWPWGAQWQVVVFPIQVLLVSVVVAAAVLAAVARFTRRLWQLAVLLTFDLLWLGAFIYLSGGVLGPGVPLLFAVILTGDLVLPRLLPFVMPVLASLVLGATAALYLIRLVPFEPTEASAGLFNPARILANLGVQVGAFFLVEILGQTLARRLHEQRVMLADLLGQLGEGVIAIDRRQQVLYANTEALALLRPIGGFPAGRDLLACLKGKARAAVTELLAQDSATSITRCETEERRWLVLRRSILRGRRGRQLGWTLTAADETRLRTLEENAARSQRLAGLGMMAAGIAHEFRNPLASLRGCSQELQAMFGELLQEDGARLAGIMVQEVDRLRRIVDDFLAFSRMPVPEPQAVALAEVFADLGSMIALRVELGQGVSMQQELASDCACCYVDPDHLRQILLNLVVNALEALAGRPAPRVILRAGPADPADWPLAGSGVTIEVADNGCGIPAAEIDLAFTPFHSTKSQGTGLGLSLVQRMVRENNGLVRLESEEGRGTTIRLVFPAAERQEGPT